MAKERTINPVWAKEGAALEAARIRKRRQDKTYTQGYVAGLLSLARLVRAFC